MLKEDFEKIKNSENFKQIINNSYLISCFLNESLIVENNLWEYNFYSKTENNVNSFILKDSQVILKDTSELLNKELPNKLLLNNLKHDKNKIILLLNEFINNNYKNEVISKKMIIIENEDFITWNLILILKNLKIINIKIKDEDSKIIENKIINPFK